MATIKGQLQGSVRFALPLAAAVGTLLHAPQALAQEQAVEPRVLEEITVTAQRREQSLQDVPIAISVLGSGDIERLNATDVRDLQFATPNLVVVSSNAAQPFFGMRGISDTSRNPGYEQRVGVYVDGIWVGRSGASNQSVLDVQSIEVLRGPQGTLFGKNTVAGAISITTRKPGPDFGGYLQAEAGNYGLWRGAGSINVPFTDNLFGKLTFSAAQRDGFAEDVVTRGKEYDDRDEQAVRAQLLWQPGDATSVELSLDDFSNDYRGLIGESTVDTIAPKPFEVALDGRQDFELGNDGIGLTVNHEFGNGFKLTSITGLRSETWSVVGADEDYRPLPIAFTDLTESDGDYLSQEVRLASPEGERFDYVVGLYYLDQDVTGRGTARVFAPALSPSAPAVYVNAAYDADVETQQIALFAHGNFRFSDQWSLTGGLRYTDEDKDLDYSISDTSTLFTNGTEKDSRSESNWAPKISLNWTPGADLLVYASYGKAFKSGGWNTDFVNDLDALPFDGEEAESIELGVKSTFAGDRVRLNAAVFESTNSDFQVQSFVQLPNGGTVLTITNAAEVTSRGFEADLQWLATDWLRLWATYGYTDAEFDSFKNCGAGGADCTGNRPAAAPENSWSLGSELTFPLLGGELFVQGDYASRDEFYSNPNNLPVTLNESLSLLNGRVGWNSPQGTWSVAAWGKNLTDEETQIWNTRSFLGIPRASYTEPRTYGLSVRWNFGGYY
jgi:iron complex outermembrane receptor protein